MSYQALYRKYRPKLFCEVVGQEDTITILKNSITNQTFSHAYLFSGARGTGKTSVAKILAKTINCEDNQTSEACGECKSCKFCLLNNENIDILEIDGASNNGVDEIRSIKNNVNLLPMNLKYKVYIIDEVHMLTTSAFNALLKTLEEPPNHIIFIFATTEPHKIPLTITSRCQWFEFKKIDSKEVENIFTKILNEESIAFEQKAIPELALLADGSLRDGINNLEKVVNFSGNLTLNSVNTIFAITSKDSKILFLKELLSKNINQVLLNINQFNQYVADFKKLLIDLIYITQDIVVYRLTSNIEIMKYLNLKEIESFKLVSEKDLRLILSEFDSIIGMGLNNHDLKAILVVRILKLTDKFDHYNFVDETKIEKVVKNPLKDTPVLNKTTIKIDDKMMDDVINVIIQADKDTRKVAKQAWNKINNLIESNKFRNFSKIYLNTIVSAACKDAIILICDNIIQAELINKKFFFQEHRSFLNFVLEKEFMMYALDKNQWKLVAKEYQELLTSNSLPATKPITLPEVKASESKEEKNETLVFLQKIFTEVEEI